MNLLQLMQATGICFMGVPNVELQTEGAARTVRIGMDGAIACDSQPSLVTVSNNGIPAFLSTYVDPKIIEILVAPMRAAEIVGNERKTGDWTTQTAMFPVVESTGEVSSYGDHSNSGVAGANTNFPQRQSYHYQVMLQWGEKQLAQAGLAKIDWANRVRLAGTLTLNKFQNKSYFYGISGLQNYGLLNDPSLSAAIVPVTKAATGTSWTNATAAEVLADIAKLYKQLQTQCPGLIDLSTPMTLAMSPVSEIATTKTTDYNVSVADMIKKNYPGLKIKTAPEYSTDSGELVQLIVDAVDGQQTAFCSFTEKLRAHAMVVESSSFKQKNSQGTWGTIIAFPAGIAQMLGV